MSTVETGQLGKFRGKIGQVVIYKWRGILVGRKSPSKPKEKTGTIEQLDQRKKFGRVGKFLRLFSDQIAIGWSSDRKKETAMNGAVRYHLKHALKGEYPDYGIDMEKVLISRGRGVIDGGFRPQATAGLQGEVHISWIISNSTSRRTQSTDRLTVVFLDENIRPGKVLPVYFNQIAQRSDSTATVILPSMCDHHPLHAYMFFSSEDGKLASKSEYLGIVTPREQ